jgi:hypothetical protein
LQRKLCISAEENPDVAVAADLLTSVIAERYFEDLMRWLPPLLPAYGAGETEPGGGMVPGPVTVQSTARGSPSVMFCGASKGRAGVLRPADAGSISDPGDRGKAPR